MGKMIIQTIDKSMQCIAEEAYLLEGTAGSSGNSGKNSLKSTIISLKLVS